MSLTVWHDGGCPLCRREIALMRRLDRRGEINFVDASDGASVCPRDRLELLNRFHAAEDGHMLSGAAAFAAMWRSIPLLRPLGLAARNPFILGSLEWLYDRFLAFRPGLQRIARRFERRSAWVLPPRADRSRPESVWDLPRPSIAQSVKAHLRVVLGGQTIANTRRGIRMIETRSSVIASTTNESATPCQLYSVIALSGRKPTELAKAIGNSLVRLFTSELVRNIDDNWVSHTAQMPDRSDGFGNRQVIQDRS